eukprot:Rmarinus@m.9661
MGGAPSKREDLVTKNITALRDGNVRDKLKACQYLRNTSLLFPDVITQAGGVELLVRMTAEGTDPIKLYAAGALRNLTVFRNHARFRKCGGVSALLNVIEDGTPEMQEQAAYVIANVVYDRDCRSEVWDCDGEALLLELVKAGKGDAVVPGAIALLQLATEESSKSVAIKKVLELLEGGTYVEQAKASLAVRHLLTDSPNSIAGRHNKALVLEADGIPDIVRLLWMNEIPEKAKGKGGIAELGNTDTGMDPACNAACIIGLLCYDDPETQELVRLAEGIKPVVRLANVGKTEARIQAAWAIENLAPNAENRFEIAFHHGVSTLENLMLDGTIRGRLHAARALVAMLSSDQALNEEVMGTGVTGALLELASIEEGEVLEGACAALTKLSVFPESNKHLLNMNAIPTLVDVILARPTSDAALYGATTLRTLAELPVFKSALREARAVRPLLAMAARSSKEHRSVAIGCLINMVIDSPENAVAVRNADGVKVVVSCLGVGDDREKSKAALALCHLASDEEGIQAAVGCGAVEMLINMLCGKASLRLKAICLAALRNIAVSAMNRARIRSKGGVEPIIRLLKVDDDACQIQAASALAQLAEDAGSRVEIREAGGLELLVQQMVVGGDAAKAEAAYALAAMAVEHDNQTKIRELGGLEPAVLVLNDGGELSIAATALVKELAREHKNKVRLRQAKGIDALISVLHTHRHAAKTNAVWALLNITTGTSFIRDVYEGKAIPPLLRFAKDDCAIGREHSLHLLSRIATGEVASRGDIRSEGGVGTLISILRDEIERLKRREDPDLLILHHDGHGPEARAAWVTRVLRYISIEHEGRQLIEDGGGKDAFAEAIAIEDSESSPLRIQAERALQVLNAKSPDKAELEAEKELYNVINMNDGANVPPVITRATPTDSSADPDAPRSPVKSPAPRKSPVRPPPPPKPERGVALAPRPKPFMPDDSLTKSRPSPSLAPKEDSPPKSTLPGKPEKENVSPVRSVWGDDPPRDTPTGRRGHLQKRISLNRASLQSNNSLKLQSFSTRDLDSAMASSPSPPPPPPRGPGVAPVKPRPRLSGSDGSKPAISIGRRTAPVAPSPLT